MTSISRSAIPSPIAKPGSKQSASTSETRRAESEAVPSSGWLERAGAGSTSGWQPDRGDAFVGTALDSLAQHKAGVDRYAAWLSRENQPSFTKALSMMGASENDILRAHGAVNRMDSGAGLLGETQVIGDLLERQVAELEAQGGAPPWGDLGTTSLVPYLEHLRCDGTYVDPLAVDACKAYLQGQTAWYRASAAVVRTEVTTNQASADLAHGPMALMDDVPPSGHANSADSLALLVLAAMNPSEAQRIGGAYFAARNDAGAAMGQWHAWMKELSASPMAPR